MARVDPLAPLRAAGIEPASVEGRVAISTGVLVLAAILAAWAVPRLVRVGRRRSRSRIAESEVADQVARAGEYVRFSLPVLVVTRALQVAVAVGTAFALLLVWGYESEADQGASVLLDLAEPTYRVALTAGLLAVAYVGTNYLEARLAAYVEDAEWMSAHQEGIVTRVLQVVVFAAAGLAALSLWHVDPGGLLVGAGFLGIVVGMAARQTLGSLIAGFVLMFSRPFEIGDWVQIGDAEGIVTDITIVNTRLRNVNEETVVMPNDAVTNSNVVNRSHRNRLRVDVEVGVDYETDLDRATEVIRESLTDLDRILRVPEPQVVPAGFADSAIVLEVRVWIDNPSARRRWQARAAVVRAVKAGFDDAGITIPFPQRTVSSRPGEADEATPERGPAVERSRSE